MNWILNTDSIRLAAKAALKIVKPNAIRSYATVARLVLTEKEAQLVATDAFRMVIYRLGAAQRGTYMLEVNLSYAALKKLAALPAKSSATIEATAYELRIIESPLVTALHYSGSSQYPNYAAVITDSVADLTKQPLLNPEYLDLRDIFPKQKKPTGVRFIARHDELFEFTDGTVRYFIVGIKEAA